MEKSDNILTGYGTGMFVSMIFTKGKKHLNIHNNPFNCDILYLHIYHIVCVCVCVCARARTHACTQLCHVQLFAIPWTIQPTLVFCLWNFPGKKTVMGCHFLLQGSFPTKESNPCILCLFHWQANSLPLAPSGKMVSSNICCQLHKEVVTLYCLMKIQGSKLYM